MMRIVGWTAWIAAGVCVAGLTAFAQQKDTDPIQFSIDLIGEHTDNRDATADGEDNDDFFVRPRVDAVFNWERTYLDLHYAPSYRYRTDPSPIQNESELFHDLGLDWEHEMTPRCKLRLEEYFYLTDDPAVTVGGTTLRRDTSYILNRIEAGLAHELVVNTILSLQANHMVKRYDEDSIAEEADEERLGGGASLARQASRTLDLLVFADAQDFGYENTATLDRDFTMVTAGVGARKVLNPQLIAECRLGLQSMDFSDATMDAADSPYARLTLQATGVPDMRFTAQAAYWLRDSDVSPFAAQQETDLLAKIEWDASAKVTFGILGRYRVGEYDEDYLPSLPAGYILGKAENGDETTSLGEASLTYRVTLDSSIKILQRYEEVDSDLGASWDRNATRLVLSQRF